MSQVGSQLYRIDVPYIDAVNSAMSRHLAKKTEMLSAVNVRSKIIGTVETRGGISITGDTITSVNNYNLSYFDDANASSNGLYRISRVGATTSIYYLNTSNVWTALSGAGTTLTSGNYNSVVAEGCLFFVNRSTDNRYVQNNGTTVTSSGTSDANTGHLYYSPAANKINFYKNRLYLGDYNTSGGTNIPNGIAFSSEPLGLMALVNVDATAPVTSLEISETKYTYAGDTLQVYRGGTLITDTLGDATTQWDVTKSGTTVTYTWDTAGTNPTVSTKLAIGSSLTMSGFGNGNDGTFTVISLDTNLFRVTNSAGVDADTNNTNITMTINTISVTAKTIDTITIKSFNTAINASDEIWINGTYTGAKKFRWVTDTATGENVKEYNTFKLTGGKNGRIKMLTNVGNKMVIANDDNMAYWDESSLQPLELGIGCVAENGYVKAFGELWFVHYTGIYKTNGGSPTLMSSKIEQYFTGSTTAGLEAATMGVKGTSIFCSLGTVTLYNADGSTKKTLSNVVVEYNIKQQNWFIHTGVNATFMTTYITTTNPDKLNFCGSTGEVYEFLTGQDDNGAEIPVEIEFYPMTLAPRFETIVYPREIILEIDKGTGAKVFVSLDGDPFYGLVEEANKGCTKIKITDKNKDEHPVCRNIAISIRDFSKTPLMLSKMAIIYVMSVESENQRQQNNVT